MKYIKRFDNKLFENISSDVNDMLDQISNFINSANRNIWLYNDSMKVYVRKSKRYYNGSLSDFFDFASIVVYEENNGFFTELIREFENRFTDINIFIESVLTDRFANYIENKLGFHRIDDQNNFYKMK